MPGSMASISRFGKRTTRQKTLKYSIALVLCGYLLLGVAHIAILPPWEGFDENAHFSYIQQIADTGTVPKQGRAKLSKDFDAYMQSAPIPYSFASSLKEPYGYTYSSFFKLPPAKIQKGQAFIHEPPQIPRKFQPGRINNWQTQHPPLYYALLAPLVKIMRGTALINQIFLLRLFSYMLAWAAMVVTAWVTYRSLRSEIDAGRTASKHWMVLGTLLIPLLFPSWFPEMARIGNDSLGAMLITLLWLVLVKIHTAGKTYRTALTVGVLLGLGCLTKVFFVPLTAGVVFFLFLNDIMAEKGDKKKSIRGTILTIFVVMAVSGWWFWGNWSEGRSLLGSNEMNEISASGGLMNMIKHHFSLKAWLRGHAAMIATMGWSCTWSLVRPPYYFLVPLAVLVIFIATAYLCTLPRFKIYAVEWLPLWCALPLILGLSHHVLLMIALTGEGRGTSGYYILMMVPLIASAIGLGLESFWPRKRFRIPAALLLLYAIGFAIVISWAQLLLFAGIFPVSSDSKFYMMPDALPPFLGIPEAVANLSVLAYPKLGLACWLLGGAFVAIGMPLVWRFTPASTAADIIS